MTESVVRVMPLPGVKGTQVRVVIVSNFNTGSVPSISISLARFLPSREGGRWGRGSRGGGGGAG